MKTRTLFLLRFLLPPLYAAFLITGTTQLFQKLAWSQTPAALGFIALYAYVFAGLPALLFAILVGRFARRRPAVGGRLVRATLAGLVAGLLITAMFGFTLPHLFLPVGAAVGLGVEGTVALLDRRAPRAA